ncbi:MAG: UbiD family decarboxylase, partial [Deltaproteobacteria bacterium]|nr:UbiD family decarboxylase [Deltaproteobacteria bacterium]
LWAFATRCHTKTGTRSFPEQYVVPLVAFLEPEEKEAAVCTKVVYDCRWPREWPEDYVPIRSSFDTMWPVDIQNKVLTRWKAYGYE